MSGTFKGFTDKDIEKINNVKEPTAAPTKKASIKNKPSSHVVTLKKMTGEKKFEIIDPKAKLSKISLKDDKVKEENIKEESDIVPISLVEENKSIVPAENQHVSDAAVPKSVDVISLEKPINLQEFQVHQKLIEEQNRKRKEMLAKALEDRSKETAEEALRLDKIRKELQTLDEQLSGDVAILRKQIDKASLVYSETEKHYHKVEKEFLEAKLTLQKDKERKELLTEHLCTLIAHNEARKAKKLESLMDQLVYKIEPITVPDLSSGVCEQTGKMLEMENGQVILRDD